MTTIRLSDVDGWLLGLAAAFPRAARKGLLAAAAKGVSTIQTQIIPMRTPVPVDRGVYRAGWHFRKTNEGADIYNAEAVAQFIEYGVRAANVKPGRNMIAALTEWVIRKRLVTAVKVKTKGLAPATRKALQQDDLHERATQVAWAIARGMQKRGIFNRPNPGLGIMAELNRNYLPGIIRTEVAFALSQEFK